MHGLISEKVEFTPQRRDGNAEAEVGSPLTEGNEVTKNEPSNGVRNR